MYTNNHAAFSVSRSIVFAIFSTELLEEFICAVDFGIHFIIYFCKTFTLFDPRMM